MEDALSSCLRTARPRRRAPLHRRTIDPLLCGEGDWPKQSYGQSWRQMWRQTYYMGWAFYENRRNKNISLSSYKKFAFLTGPCGFVLFNPVWLFWPRRGPRTCRRTDSSSCWYLSRHSKAAAGHTVTWLNDYYSNDHTVVVIFLPSSTDPYHSGQQNSSIRWGTASMKTLADLLAS